MAARVDNQNGCQSGQPKWLPFEWTIEMDFEANRSGTPKCEQLPCSGTSKREQMLRSGNTKRQLDYILSVELCVGSGLHE
jgi:hypothetical protein